MRLTSRLRAISVVALFTMTLAACGGGTDQAPGDTSGDTTGQTSGDTTTPTEGGSGDISSTTQGAAGPAGSNSIQYTISDGYESSGQHALVPSMSFFDSGVWTFTFGDEGGALLIVNLDPSTPSVNFTDGGASASGDASQCDFEITRQDEDGASGSFSCSNVPVVNAGVLTEAGEFSGTFDANP